MKETKIGNMSAEIVEAIEEYFHYEEDIATDCLLFLSKMDKDNTFAPFIERWFEDHHRCSHCGEHLVNSVWREYHPEVDAWENVEETFCPRCM